MSTSLSMYRIPDSPERRELSGAESRSPSKHLEDLPHLELVEKAGINSTGFSCIEHAFSDLPWYTESFDRWRLMRAWSLRDLQLDFDFKVVKQSEPSSHIAYLTDWETGLWQPVHYAKVESGLTVTSKFGENGPVYRHDARLVPDVYGELLVFLAFQPNQ